MKEIKLKNGEILTITAPTLDDAQELADFANTIRCQSRYITMGEEDDPCTLISQEKRIQTAQNDDKYFIISAKLVRFLYTGIFLSAINSSIELFSCTNPTTLIFKAYLLLISSAITLARLSVPRINIFFVFLSLNK